MKILFITQSYLPLSKGGTELYLYNLSRQLQERNTEATICVSNPTLQDVQPYEHDGVAIYPSSTTVDLVETVFALTGSGEYDLIHVHSMGGNVNELMLEQLQSIPLPLFFTPHLVSNFCLNAGKLLYKNEQPCNGFVSTVKCQVCISSTYPAIPVYYKKKFFQFTIQFLLPQAMMRRLLQPFHFLAKDMKRRIDLMRKGNTRLISVAKWYQDVLRINGLLKTTFIPQGLSGNFLPETHEPNHDFFRWVFAGRLSAEKGVDDLVSIFDANKRPGDQLVLLLFLTEPSTPFEIAFLNKIKQHKSIVLHVNLDAGEVARIMRTCNCLVLPTKICEMAPLVIIEAYSCKVPVLTSTFIKEPLDIKRGLKFNYEIEGDFADKFKQMRRDSKQFTEEGFNNYQPCTFVEVADMHLELYRQNQ